MQRPGKINDVKQIHAIAKRCCSMEYATLPKPAVVEHERLAAAERNSVEVSEEGKDERDFLWHKDRQSSDK